MAKNKKVPKEEIIPEGMNKKDFADAAFRKKVTIINGCILLAFIIGVVAVIGVGWYNTKIEDELFEQKQQAFYAERDAIKAQLQKIEADGGSHEDKSAVKIEVRDDTYYDWIGALDASYQADKDSEDYAAFAGAEIHIQGMFVTREFEGGAIQYWLYRNHDHSDHDHDHTHAHEEAHENADSHNEEFNIGEMIPIEIIFAEETEVPENGTWIDVVGIVGPDSTKNLSGIRNAEFTIMDEPGQEYVE